jgi:hypothetical protein
MQPGPVRISRSRMHPGGPTPPAWGGHAISLSSCDGPIGCFCSFGLSLRHWEVRTKPTSQRAQPNEHS